jgi:hypothetical protein
MLVMCISRGFDRSGGNVLEITSVPDAVFVFWRVLRERKFIKNARLTFWLYRGICLQNDSIVKQRTHQEARLKYAIAQH